MGYIGNSYNSQTFMPATDFFSGNGVTTTFTLTRPIQSNYGIEVVVNNVQQNPSNTFTINAANQIVFVAAPSVGTNNIYVYYNTSIAQQNSVGQGTVGTQQLGSVSTINSIGSNMTLQTNGTTALTVDQSQNITVTNGNLTLTNGSAAVTNGNFSVGSGAPALYSKATVYYSGLYDTATRRYLDVSGDFAGTNAAAATNAGAQTGIRMGYPALPGKYAVVAAVSEDALGYARKTGLTFQTAAYDTAAVERMRITGDGYMLRPKQPAFMIYGTGGSTAYGDAAEFNIGTGVNYDSTNSYSTANGRYTAPVAGFYSFSYGAYTYVSGQMSFKKNGVTWAPSDSIGLCTAATSEIRGTTVYISLAAGDYVSFGWRSGYSGNIYHSHSWFAGHLVG